MNPEPLTKLDTITVNISQNHWTQLKDTLLSASAWWRPKDYQYSTYLLSLHSIHYEVASVESKRRAGLSIICSYRWWAGFPQPEYIKINHAQLSVQLASKQDSASQSHCNNHHFLLCLAMLSLDKLPLWVWPPPPAETPWGGPTPAPGGLSPAAETGGAIWPMVALPKQTHTQRSHISV